MKRLTRRALLTWAIIGVAAIGLLACLYYFPARPSLASYASLTTPLLFDILQKLTASFAFLIGGIWVLMNYIRNRTHVPRLQVEVKAEVVKRGDQHFLLATCQAKNVGLSIIRLPDPNPKEQGGGLPGTALFVRTLPRMGAEHYIIEVPWSPEEPVAAFDVFTSHRAIEPGLTISEQKLIYQPTGYDASWVQLRVSAHDEKWSAVAVAIPEGS